MLCTFLLLLSYPAGHAYRLQVGDSNNDLEGSDHVLEGCPNELWVDRKDGRCYSKESNTTQQTQPAECCDDVRKCLHDIPAKQELLANRFQLYGAHCGAREAGVLVPGDSKGHFKVAKTNKLCSKDCQKIEELKELITIGELESACNKGGSKDAWGNLQAFYQMVDPLQKAFATCPKEVQEGDSAHKDAAFKCIIPGPEFPDKAELELSVTFSVEKCMTQCVKGHASGSTDSRTQIDRQYPKAFTEIKFEDSVCKCLVDGQIKVQFHTVDQGACKSKHEPAEDACWEEYKKKAAGKPETTTSSNGTSFTVIRRDLSIWSEANFGETDKIKCTQESCTDDKDCSSYIVPSLVSYLDRNEQSAMVDAKTEIERGGKVSDSVKEQLAAYSESDLFTMEFNILDKADGADDGLADFDYVRDFLVQRAQILHPGAKELPHSAVERIINMDATESGWKGEEQINLVMYIKIRKKQEGGGEDEGQSRWMPKDEKPAEIDDEKPAELEDEKPAELEEENPAELEDDNLAESEHDNSAYLEYDKPAELEHEKLAELEDQKLAQPIAEGKLFQPIEHDGGGAKKLVFVVDVSSSMKATFRGKSRLDLLKQELLNIINTKLKPEDQFDIIKFHHEYEMLSQGLLLATPENKQTATNWINAMVPGGATVIREPLRKAIDLRPEADVIYLLSDGMPQLPKNTKRSKNRAFQRDSPRELCDTARCMPRPGRRQKIHTTLFMPGEGGTDEWRKAHALLKAIAYPNGKFHEPYCEKSPKVAPILAKGVCE